MDFRLQSDLIHTATASAVLCCAVPFSDILISSGRLSRAAPVNEATDAFDRHPLLVQVSMRVQRAVAIAVCKRALGCLYLRKKRGGEPTHEL